MREGSKRLLLAWSAMAALTGAAVFVGHARSGDRLGMIPIAALLGMAFIKASVLLSEYLELSHAPRWNAALRFSIFLLLAAIFGLSAVAALR